MEAPKTKFKVGQKVYVFTPDGLVLKEINNIAVFIKKDEVRVRYYTEEYGTGYNEN